MMKGYKVSIKALGGQRIDCFTGYLKTREDAEKYAKWVGRTAKIKECTRKKINTYAVYSETNSFRLKYI